MVEQDISDFEYLAQMGGTLQGLHGLGSSSLGFFPALADRWAHAAPDIEGDMSAWAEWRLHEHMWSAQKQIATSVSEHRYTAVHSAHDLGKSFVASRLASWWIDTHPPGEAFVVSTAPTAAQVSAILWREIAKTHRKGNLQGRINRAGYPQWYMGAELVGYGRKPADWEESAFQGIHAKYVLVLIDEACGVAKNIFDAVDALVTNEHSRVLAIGNPDIPGSHFHSVCRPGSGWNVMHLDGLRSPNITVERVIGDDPDHPKYPLLAALMEADHVPYSTEDVHPDLRDLLVSELWIEERLRRWCGLSAIDAEAFEPEELQKLVLKRTRQSPLFTAKVRGVFPDSTADGVIPLGWVQLAINRWHDLFDPKPGKIQTPATGNRTPNRTDGTYVAPADRPKVSELAIEPGRLVLGVDVARQGEDETAVAFRYGNVVEKVERFHIADTVETAEYVAERCNEIGAVAVVDVVGIGAGVFDYLRRMRRDNKTKGKALAFNAAGASVRTDQTGEFRFRNDRAAAWWTFREALDPSKGSTVCLPDDERLVEELVATGYHMNVGAIIVIEEKDEIRRRIGRSTDSADAVVQAFWVNARPQDVKGMKYENAKSRKQYKLPPGYAHGVELHDPNAFDPDDFGYSPGSLSPPPVLGSLGW